MSTRSPEEKLIAIGKVVAAHGIKGLLQVLPLTDFPERYTERPRVFAERPDGSRVAVKVVKAIPHKSQYLIGLEGLTTRTEAEAFVGAELKVPAADATPLPEGSYYQFQLIGLRVTDEAGRDLGQLREVISGSANDVYVVSDGRRDLLLPATREVVRRVDLAAGVIVARPLEEFK